MIFQLKNVSDVKQVEKQMHFRLKSEYDRLQQVTKDANDAVRQLQTATKHNQSEVRNMQQQFTRNTEGLLKKYES